MEKINHFIVKNISSPIIFVGLFLLISGSVTAQNIPLGTWRTHFSYYKAKLVEVTEDKIYVASENGLFFYDKDDQAVTKISKSDGLQSENITALYFSEAQNQLYIGYADGNLDVVVNNEIINVDLTTTAQVIGDKGINSFVELESQLFIGTDYGLLKYNQTSLQVEETYREIGVDGATIHVNDLAIMGDSVYLATNAGIISNSLRNQVNRFDFRTWKRYDMPNGNANNGVIFITNYEGYLLAGVDHLGLIQLNQGITTTVFEDLTAEFYNGFTSNGIMYFVEDKALFSYSSNEVTPITNTFITQVNDAFLTVDGVWWVADENKALVTNYQQGNQFYSIMPEGPYSNEFFSINNLVDGLFVASGGYSNNLQPLGYANGFYQFSNGRWSNYNTNITDGFPAFNDVTDVTYSNGIGAYFAASFGSGLLKFSLANDSYEVYDNTTPGSPLITDLELADKVLITAIEGDSRGLWVLNYGSDTPLLLLQPDGQWRPFFLTNQQAKYATDMLLVDQYVWLLTASGIIVFDPETNNSRLLNNSTSNGGIVGNEFKCFSLDKDGYVWIGTDNGVSVFTNPYSVFEGTVDAVEPIFDSQLLLIGEEVNDILVDGGNRKWFATDKGAWLFDALIEQEVLFFDADNSPLPSSIINEIGIDNQLGEVFFSTNDGVVSFRADATEPEHDYSNVKVFPNPVTSHFNGTIAISGLASNVIVKITNVSGKLIWQTKSNGGTATWDGADYNGKRAQTGVYLIFVANNDGEDTFVGKIAVVD